MEQAEARTAGAATATTATATAAAATAARSVMSLVARCRCATPSSCATYASIATGLAGAPGTTGAGTDRSARHRQRRVVVVDGERPSAVISGSPQCARATAPTATTAPTAVDREARPASGATTAATATGDSRASGPRGLAVPHCRRPGERIGRSRATSAACAPVRGTHSIAVPSTTTAASCR